MITGIETMVVAAAINMGTALGTHKLTTSTPKERPPIVYSTAQERMAEQCVVPVRCITTDLDFDFRPAGCVSWEKEFYINGCK